MRALLLLMVIAPCLMAQNDVTDPEYIVPHENPYATEADVNAGRKLFLAQCARCHGPKGEGGLGAVLAQPRLRRAADDEALFKVIRDGINGTDMPGGYALDTREKWQVAAYVRGLGRIPVEKLPGDPGNGKKIFSEKARCVQCHVVEGKGGTLGPELTDVGARRSPAHLRSAVLDPESELREGFLLLKVTERNGNTIQGIRMNEDTFSIQIRDMSGRIHSWLKDDLAGIERDTGKSPMPAFRKALSESETDDLVAYLATLRGKQ